MKLLKAEYESGRKVYEYLCDVCMTAAHTSLPSKGMWFLDCGHHLCTSCTDYGLRHNKKPHIDICPTWKIGSFPTDDDEGEKQLKAQEDLQQRGFKLGQGGVWSPTK